MLVGGRILPGVRGRTKVFSGRAGDAEKLRAEYTFRRSRVSNAPGGATQQKAEASGSLVLEASAFNQT